MFLCWLLYVDVEEELRELVFVFEEVGVRDVVELPLWPPVLVDPRLLEDPLVPLWVCAERAAATNRHRRILNAGPSVTPRMRSERFAGLTISIAR